MDSWTKKRTAWLAGHWVWVKWLENQQSWEACRYTLWKWELCVKVFVLHHHQRASAMEDGLNSQVVKMTQTLTLQLLSLALYHHQKWNTRIQEPGVAPEGNPADLSLRMCSCDCIDGDHAQAKQNGLHFSRLIQLLQLPNFQPVRNRTRCWVCDIAASFEDANSHLRASWWHWIPYPPTVAARNSDRNMYVF